MGTTLYVNTWPLHAPYSPLYSYHIPFAGRLPYMYVDRTKYTLLTTDSDPVYEDFYQYSYTLAKQCHCWTDRDPVIVSKLSLSVCILHISCIRSPHVRVVIEIHFPPLGLLMVGNNMAG